MKRTLIALAILLPITLIAGAGYLGYQNARATAEPPPAAPVTVAVTRGDVQQTVTAPGQLVGTHETILGMDVSGRLLQVNVRPGTVVKAGDVLARLDPKPFERALARAEIKLARTEAAYEQQVAEAKLATQNSEALVGSTQAQFPSLTAAEVNLQAAIDAQARAESEYDKALNRTWEPPMHIGLSWSGSKGAARSPKRNMTLYLASAGRSASKLPPSKRKSSVPG